MKKETTQNTPNANIGVIHEQGFVAGKLGFENLNEQDQEKLKNKNKKEK